MTTEQFKVDLTKIKPTTLVVDSIKIGAFEIKALDDRLYLQRVNRPSGITITPDDVFINGKSFSAVNNVLENHYNALKKLIEK